MEETVVFDGQSVIEGKNIRLVLTLISNEEISDKSRMIYSLYENGVKQELVVNISKKSNAISPKFFDLGSKEQTCSSWCAGSAGVSIIDCLRKSSNKQEFLKCLSEQGTALGFGLINCIYQCASN